LTSLRKQFSGAEVRSKRIFPERHFRGSQVDFVYYKAEHSASRFQPVCHTCSAGCIFILAAGVYKMSTALPVTGMNSWFHAYFEFPSEFYTPHNKRYLHLTNKIAQGFYHVYTALSQIRRIFKENLQRCDNHFKNFLAICIGSFY